MAMIADAGTVAPAETETPIPPPLGQMLLAKGLLAAVDLERGLAFQQRFGGRLGAVLVRIGALPESELLVVLSEQLGMPVIAAAAMPSDPSPIETAAHRSGVAVEWWLDQGAILWQDVDGRINCAARDPLAPSLAEAVERSFPEDRVQWWLA